MTWIIALLREVAYALVSAPSQFEAVSIWRGTIEKAAGARIDHRMRRLFASENRRERQRVRVQVIYRPVETA